MISRMLKNIGLFCKRDLQKRPVFCKETYIFRHPTNRSHLIRPNCWKDFWDRSEFINKHLCVRVCERVREKARERHNLKFRQTLLPISSPEIWQLKCVCVCERERERKREGVYVCVCESVCSELFPDISSPEIRQVKCACVCVCVCVRERERKRERVCETVCVFRLFFPYLHLL